MSLPKLLSVEDSDPEFFLVQMALLDCHVDYKLLRATDGEEAVELLKRGFQSPDGLPNVVLLDINLPKKGGFEVLEFMRAQEFLKKVPVVMFSSSRDPRDRKRAFAMGADEFVSKPSDLGQMTEVLVAICEKYLTPSGELH